ncbi:MULTISPECIES: alkaline phosphatase D family protein [unclassified Saccharicrinis]|uniref:alkaline phosphatase D family protein n=1 Tax=unclassified Saccharicrinis TaxID=2646859 RepID=UPI003D334C4B
MKERNENQAVYKPSGLLIKSSKLSSVLLVVFMLLGMYINAQDVARFSHGPMLGRLGSHEIGIWARTFKPGTFWVRYGVNPENLDQLSDPVTTSIDHDNTGVVYIKDLKAGTKYYYALTVQGGTATMLTRKGSFKTLPDSDELKDTKVNPDGLFNFSFEYACGNSQSTNGLGTTLPTFRTMIDQIKDKIHFAILNGDWLYENKRDYSVESWKEQVGIEADEIPEVVNKTPKIVGVWENYKSYLERGHNLVEWHKHVPSFYTIDDHEIYDNTYGAGEIGRVNHKAVYRDVAVQAWHDYLAWSNPTEFTQGIHLGKAKIKANSDILTDTEADFTKLDLAQSATLHIHWGGPYDGMRRIPEGTKPGNPNSGVYKIVEVIDAHHVRVFPTPKKNGKPVYSIGRRNYGKMSVSNSDIFILDVRSHQDMHDTSNPYKKGLSILGKEQKAWLKEEMKNSDAEFFFLVSSVNFTIPHEGGTGGNTADGKAKGQTGRDDAWTSYIEERKEMVDFWESLGKPVFVLTGDLHNSFAVKVSDNVWEFASGPHNSRNHALGAEGNRPVNGKFNSRGREVDIRWSTAILNDVPNGLRYTPSYCVVQINNVFNNPIEEGKDRWVAFPRPQVIFQYFNGLTGDLLYSETIQGSDK